MILRNFSKFVFRSPLVNVETQINGLTADQLKQLPLLEQTWLIMTYMKFALMRRTKSLPLQHSCTMASFTKSKMASATWLILYSKWSNKHITFFIPRKNYHICKVCTVCKFENHSACKILCEIIFTGFKMLENYHLF